MDINNTTGVSDNEASEGRVEDQQSVPGSAEDAGGSSTAQGQQDGARFPSFAYLWLDASDTSSEGEYTINSFVEDSGYDTSKTQTDQSVNESTRIEDDEAAGNAEVQVPVGDIVDVLASGNAEVLVPVPVEITEDVQASGNADVHVKVEEAAQAPEKANAQIPVSSHAQQLRPHVDEWQKPSPTRELDDTNIYVARLPREMTPDEFYKLIRKYGLVTSYRLLKGEDEDGKPVPRVGFARMTKAADAALAVENLNNMFLPGSKSALRARLAYKNMNFKGDQTSESGWPLRGYRDIDRGFDDESASKDANDTAPTGSLPAQPGTPHGGCLLGGLAATTCPYFPPSVNQPHVAGVCLATSRPAGCTVPTFPTVDARGATLECVRQAASMGVFIAYCVQRAMHHQAGNAAGTEIPRWTSKPLNPLAPPWVEKEPSGTMGLQQEEAKEAPPEQETVNLEDESTDSDSNSTDEGERFSAGCHGKTDLRLQVNSASKRRQHQLEHPIKDQDPLHRHEEPMLAFKALKCLPRDMKRADEVHGVDPATKIKAVKPKAGSFDKIEREKGSPQRGQDLYGTMGRFREELANKKNTPAQLEKKSFKKATYEKTHKKLSGCASPKLTTKSTKINLKELIDNADDINNDNRAFCKIVDAPDTTQPDVCLLLPITMAGASNVKLDA